MIVFACLVVSRSFTIFVCGGMDKPETMNREYSYPDLGDSITCKVMERYRAYVSYRSDIGFEIYRRRYKRKKLFIRLIDKMKTLLEKPSND